MPLAARLRAIGQLPAIAITKANTKSTVHRATYLDFIGIKRYAADGRVIGEHRILGLFTSAAYNLQPARHSAVAAQVRGDRQARRPSQGSHTGKALANILDTYPRDELFQADEDTLLRDHLADSLSAGSSADPPVRAKGRLRSVRLLPDLHSARALQHGRARTLAEHC